MALIVGPESNVDEGESEAVALILFQRTCRRFCKLKNPTAVFVKAAVADEAGDATIVLGTTAFHGPELVRRRRSRMHFAIIEREIRRMLRTSYSELVF